MTRARDVADTQDNLGGAVAPFVAGKNKLINGDFGVWQRGTSFAINTYSADRWVSLGDAVTTTSQQTFTPGTAPVAGYEGTYFQRTAKSAGGSYLIQEQRIEDVRIFAGQTVTLSFWAKADANVACAPSFAQFFNGSATVDTILSSVTITTTWARYSFTVALPSISGKTIGSGNYLAARPIRVLGSAATTIDLWGVQLEAGSVATPFTTASGSIGGELALCQRYYYRFVGSQTTGSTIANICNASMQSASNASGVFEYPVQMRSAPSFYVHPSATGIIQISGGFAFPSPLTLVTADLKRAMLKETTTGQTTGFGCILGLSNTVNDYFELSAEL